MTDRENQFIEALQDITEAIGVDFKENLITTIQDHLSMPVPTTSIPGKTLNDKFDFMQEVIDLSCCPDLIDLKYIHRLINNKMYHFINVLLLDEFEVQNRYIARAAWEHALDPALKQTYH